MLADELKKLKMPWDHASLFENPEQRLIYGDYFKMGLPRDERRYEEILETQRLPHIFSDYLDEYNADNKEMRLVFFWDAIEHISRLCRVLRQPRGNAMLVGVGGSGKQSLTRFAGFVSEVGSPCAKRTRPRSGKLLTKPLAILRRKIRCTRNNPPFFTGIDCNRRHMRPHPV